MKYERNLFKKKMIKTMNIKKAANSELSKTESTNKLTKQTTRTGTESQLWTPFGGLSAGRAKGENKGKYVGIKKYRLVGTKQTR